MLDRNLELIIVIQMVNQREQKDQQLIKLLRSLSFFIEACEGKKETPTKNCEQDLNFTQLPCCAKKVKYLH